MTFHPAPTLSSVLSGLPKARLVDLGREFDTTVRVRDPKGVQVNTLARSALTLERLLRSLGRDELKAACRNHGLDAGSPARSELAGLLLAAAGEKESAPRARFEAEPEGRATPKAGDVVQVRQRQYLVEGTVLPAEKGELTRVDLVCLDDDNQGCPLTVLWELELAARILQVEEHALPTPEALDSPHLFAAYLHTLQWNAVTATDARLFQAPFRAGISLRGLNHQLTPLKKALELPRANLLIADDVGLGKTIEAGLVLQELRLRQRLEWVVVVCPAAICLQWQSEMAKRFGLHFEIYNRAFVAHRRRERGFAVNPWTTHNRFIISYHTLRRPEYRDPLLNHLEARGKKKSLLVLDEAHTAAPASAARYAVDSGITHVVRNLAPLFENRLFLSATPHNGHSNSFSALLEILDPQRFTRGVPIAGPEELDAVMVRRLKSDLRALSLGRYPHRRVVEVQLQHRDGAWTSTWKDGTCEPGTGGPGEPLVIPLDLGEHSFSEEAAELRLSELLHQYLTLLKLKGKRRGLGFILQKRLLSSVCAFGRTLEAHGDRIERKGGMEAVFGPPPDAAEEDEYGDEALDNAADEHTVAVASRDLTPAAEARELLRQMRRWVARHRDLPDAKVLALLAWIRRELRPNSSWGERRVLIFTEYGDTRLYLEQQLRNALADTHRGDERILQFYGGMDDERREEVQAAFNAPPNEHPVRILLATDAAREGVNLQGHCQDLFHFDIPWNPARMEQRNGRIDRTLQPAEEVRCHYFTYPQRREDAVLRKLVEKVEVIQAELGSLSTVVFDHIQTVMEQGIDEDTAEALDVEERGNLEARLRTTRREVEGGRDLDSRDLSTLQGEVDEAGEILDNSRRLTGFEPHLLRRAVDAGLTLAGHDPLHPVPETTPPTFRLPALPTSWQRTLDALRPARRREETFWEWRRQLPLPVAFEGLERLTSKIAQLHLEHPFVERVLSRFLAQGYSAHDLSRVTAVRTRKTSTPRVVAFGRLSIFGDGATRLHDQMLYVAARWTRSQGPRTFADEAKGREVHRDLEEIWQQGEHRPLDPRLAQELCARAADDFEALWPHIRAEADELSHRAESGLQERGASEAAQLRRILERQREAIRRELEGTQMSLIFDDPSGELSAAERQQRLQFERDREHMALRLDHIDEEIAREPEQIEELYAIALRRLVPVGLVYLWPESMG